MASPPTRCGGAAQTARNAGCGWGRTGLRASGTGGGEQVRAAWAEGWVPGLQAQQAQAAHFRSFSVQACHRNERQHQCSQLYGQERVPTGLSQACLQLTGTGPAPSSSRCSCRYSSAGFKSKLYQTGKLYQTKK